MNISGTLKQEFIITDQQGNARISFQDNGSGVALVKQENSYYGFGMLLPNSPVATPTTPNKQLYNGGSEWQNDFSNLPDYQQTFFRNYDAALGRWVAVDPMAESAESLTTYQYAGNNPILANDPMGNLIKDPPSSNGPNNSNWADAFLSNLTSVNPGIESTIPADIQSSIDGYFNLAENPGGLYAQDPALANYLAQTTGKLIYSSISHVGSIDNVISAVYNMTGQLLGSNAGVTYNGLNYSYSTTKATSDLSATGGTGFEFTLHNGVIGSNVDFANQGGVSSPASWDFTPVGPGGAYQIAGVRGINFTFLYYSFDLNTGKIKIGFNHLNINTLYFEYPLIRETKAGYTYTVPPGVAATNMAIATDAAIEATETAWGHTEMTPVNIDAMTNTFINSLRLLIRPAGGRVTLEPNYFPVQVNQYRTF